MLLTRLKKIVFLFVFCINATAACPFKATCLPLTSPKTLSPSQLDQIKERQLFRIGMLKTLTPFYSNAHEPNQLSGFEYSLLNTFSKKLNITLTVTRTNTINELITLLKHNKIDLIAEVITDADQHSDTVSHTLPYYHMPQYLVYHKNRPEPESFQQLKGKLVIANQSPQRRRLFQIQHNFPSMHWYESPFFNKEEILHHIAAHKTDYTISDPITISLMRQIYPVLAVAKLPLNSLPMSWAIAKSSDRTLLSALNEFIHESQKKGRIDHVAHRYLSNIDEFDYVHSNKFLNAINNTLPKYLPYFKKYATQYDLDWRLIAALSYQESHWDPLATSVTGVRGIMMITNKTAESLGIRNRLDPKESIRGGIHYLHSLMRRISKDVPENERIWHALVAYNMGFGHLLDARRLARHLGKDPNNWFELQPILPLLESPKYRHVLKYGLARGRQAFHFIRQIQTYYRTLVGYEVEKTYRKKQIQSQMTQAK